MRIFGKLDMTTSSLHHWSRAGGRWLLAVSATTVLGTIVQTQFNLYALVELGQQIGPGLWLHTTLLDLVRFAPPFAAIVAGGFLVALPVSSWLCRRGRRRWLQPLAGAVAILLALLLMRWLLGLTPIAAARSALGLGALVLAGALGGWVWGRSKSPA